MNCELCNDKIVIVPPPTVCFACASALQNLRAANDSLRAELHKINIENGGIKSACATLLGDIACLRTENERLEALRISAQQECNLLRKQLMNNSPSTASDSGKQPD